MNWAGRIAAWLIKRYPSEFRRAHERELRDASEWTLAESPGVWMIARLIANLAAGALAQHAAEFAADVRYACRALGRSKWFALGATLSLGIGIGTVLPIYLTFAATVFRNVDAIARPGPAACPQTAHLVPRL